MPGFSKRGKRGSPEGRDLPGNRQHIEQVINEDFYAFSSLTRDKLFAIMNLRI
jgi:hypothetical protein